MANPCWSPLGVRGVLVARARWVAFGRPEEEWLADFREKLVRGAQKAPEVFLFENFPTRGGTLVEVIGSGSSK